MSLPLAPPGVRSMTGSRLAQPPSVGSTNGSSVHKLAYLLERVCHDVANIAREPQGLVAGSHASNTSIHSAFLPSTHTPLLTMQGLIGMYIALRYATTSQEIQHIFCGGALALAGTHPRDLCLRRSLSTTIQLVKRSMAQCRCMAHVQWLQSMVHLVQEHCPELISTRKRLHALLLQPQTTQAQKWTQVDMILKRLRGHGVGQGDEGQGVVPPPPIVLLFRSRAVMTCLSGATDQELWDFTSMHVLPVMLHCGGWDGMNSQATAGGGGRRVCIEGWESCVQLWLSASQAHSLPQQFELSTVNWLLERSNRLPQSVGSSSVGSSGNGYGPSTNGIVVPRIAFVSSYEVLVQEPLLLFRALSFSFLSIPPVLAIILHILENSLLPASRILLRRTLNAKKRTSGMFNQARPFKGLREKSLCDISEHVSYDLYTDLQDLMVCRVLIALLGEIGRCTCPDVLASQYNDDRAVHIERDIGAIGAVAVGGLSMQMEETLVGTTKRRRGEEKIEKIDMIESKEMEGMKAPSSPSPSPSPRTIHQAFAVGASRLIQAGRRQIASVLQRILRAAPRIITTVLDLATEKDLNVLFSLHHLAVPSSALDGGGGREGDDGCTTDTTGSSLSGLSTAPSTSEVTIETSDAFSVRDILANRLLIEIRTLSHALNELLQVNSSLSTTQAPAILDRGSLRKLEGCLRQAHCLLSTVDYPSDSHAFSGGDSGTPVDPYETLSMPTASLGIGGGKGYSGEGGVEAEEMEEEAEKENRRTIPTPTPTSAPSSVGVRPSQVTYTVAAELPKLIVLGYKTFTVFHHSGVTDVVDHYVQRLVSV